MALTFGVTVLPDPPYQRLVELIQLAERHGFEYGWTYDSHVRAAVATSLPRRPGVPSVLAAAGLATRCCEAAVRRAIAARAARREDAHSGDTGDRK